MCRYVRRRSKTCVFGRQHAGIPMKVGSLPYAHARGALALLPVGMRAVPTRVRWFPRLAGPHGPLRHGVPAGEQCAVRQLLHLHTGKSLEHLKPRVVTSTSGHA